GDNGNDYLSAGSDNDYLYGNDGRDTMYGSSGDDYLDGGIDGDADYLHGGSGKDRFRQELYTDWFPWPTTKNRDGAADFAPWDDLYV
ncbi:MAG: calcium-binding protein, partial [Gemmataceae bacterium]